MEQAATPEKEIPKGLLWPPKGTPEYEAKLAKMREGHARRLQKAQQQGQERPGAAPTPPADLIDVGEPKAVRMAPEPRPEEKTKKKPAARGKGGEFDQKDVHRHIRMGLEILARMPGHEHWHREDDEIELVAEPATRCLNRLDPALIEKLRTVSDPAALFFACVMVLGPSVMEELRNVRSQSPGPKGRPAHRPEPARQPEPHEPEGAAGPGYGGGYFGNSAPMAANGAQPTPAVADLPAVGI